MTTTPTPQAVPEWTGDLDDDCVLRWGGMVAHCECMGDHECRDPDFPREKWTSQQWFFSVSRGDEMLIHSGEAGGTVTTGALARTICEAIMRAAVPA